MLLRKNVLEIYSKFAGENTCQSVISTKLLCNFIEITLHHGGSPLNLMYIFRTTFPKNTSGGLLLLIFISRDERGSAGNIKRRSENTSTALKF